jgi:hypothetical protein
MGGTLPSMEVAKIQMEIRLKIEALLERLGKR